MSGRRHEARPLDPQELERASRERLDDELLRECRALLESPHDPARRAHAAPPRRRQRREHLIIARLAFEAELFASALARTEAALTAHPGDPEALSLLGAIQHRRGRLSDAVEAWEALAAQKASEPSGLRDLGLVYELSAHAGDWRLRPMPIGLEAALGDALADLAQSCRQALVDDLPGALRAADRAMARAQGRNAHVSKVAAIQRAWVLERAHDVQAAIAALERLADEPGLANDVERLICLSVLYEREGTPERVRRAVRAVRYAYLVTREPPLLRRLARLLRHLGYDGIADRFEARYLEIFLRDHGALSARELARAASSTYVPLERLQAIPVPRAEAKAQMSAHAQRSRPHHRRREAALALHLGEIDRARDLLREVCEAPAATAIDKLYLADIEEQMGDVQRARERRLEALRHADRPEPHALISLASDPSAADALAEVGSPERLERWFVAMRSFVEIHPEQAPAWRALSLIAHLRGRAAAAREHADHARALELAGDDPPAPIVLAAAALRRGGEMHGVIHEIWVERVPCAVGGGLSRDDVLGSVSGELSARAVNVFHSVHAFARARFPHRLRRLDGSRFLLKITKDDQVSSGESAGLPMAIVFLAALLDLQVPGDIAASGAVVCDARDVVMVRRVGDVEAKVVGAYQRRLRKILLPADNRDDVARAERVPPAIAAEIVHYVRTLEEVCAELFPELG